MIRNKLFALVPVVGLSFALLTLAPSPGSGHVSVPAAAFVPAASSYEYINNGYSVLNYGGSGPYFMAPVHLPHGATVTKVTFYFHDASSATPDWGSVELYRNEHDNNQTCMAGVYTTDDGDSSDYDDTISYATIDNSQYSYYLKLHLNSEPVWAYGVIVEYTYPVSLPLVLRDFLSGPGGR